MPEVRIRRDTPTDWASDAAILKSGEPAIVDQPGRQHETLKIGDGLRTYTQLPRVVPEQIIDNRILVAAQVAQYVQSLGGL